MNKLMTQEEVDDAVQFQRKYGGPTPDRPISERKETVEYQMQWLKEGKRKCVYIPKNCDLPDAPYGFPSLVSLRGTYIYNPKKISSQEIIKAEQDNKIGDLLEYGISEKPRLDDLIGAVTLRDSHGIEKQSVAVDLEHLRPVWERAHVLAENGDSVEFETTDFVIDQRINYGK